MGEDWNQRNRADKQQRTLDEILKTIEHLTVLVVELHGEKTVSPKRTKRRKVAK